MSFRPVPEFLYDFLKRVEGVRLKAYPDSKGVWTIGVGHTGPEVHKGLIITAAKVDEYLRSDIMIAVKRLYGVVKEEVILAMTDHQYAALLSFVFNLGANRTWGFWKVVNASRFDDVPAYMMRFNKAIVNGKSVTVPGLTSRRAEEVKLWAVPDAHVVQAVTPPSSELRAADTPPAALPDAKPLVQSKTVWTGAATAAAGAAQGFASLQNMAAPQAVNSDMIQKVVAFCAMAIVGLGVAVMVFRWLDERKKHA